MSNTNDLPWRPWTLTDLAAPPPSLQQEETAPSDSEDEDTSPVEALESLELLREEVQLKAKDAGYKDGQQRGYDEGYQTGLAEGRQQGAQEEKQQQEKLTEQMQQMVTEFQQTLDSLDSVITARLMQMALTAAKQVLGQAPVCDGTALLNQIQQMIQQEPLFSGKPNLRVHPSDMERVEKQLGPTLAQHGWRLLADNQLHPGGCKVSAEDGDLDASIATRWHELCHMAAPGEL
ncbi:flagellar assembly protein H [Lonsdalea britannica]|uniref:Flagellar assembly protein FliH n=1 Tax=Lonsdalea britannica TaxID=1082704 RepID=A0AAD0WL92_9GAMM|nr:flagellar assembly protein FliH [Lonsdalea britannica]AXW87622.1 flagellar assembly protein FliH [Lonsdalea britannica]OSM96721.1 flagellar assembly protein H [Lonsdalea britannica]